MAAADRRFPAGDGRPDGDVTPGSTSSRTLSLLVVLVGLVVSALALVRVNPPSG